MNECLCKYRTVFYHLPASWFFLRIVLNRDYQDYLAYEKALEEEEPKSKYRGNVWTKQIYDGKVVAALYLIIWESYLPNIHGKVMNNIIRPA